MIETNTHAHWVRDRSTISDDLAILATRANTVARALDESNSANNSDLSLGFLDLLKQFEDAARKAVSITPQNSPALPICPGDFEEAWKAFQTNPMDCVSVLETLSKTAFDHSIDIQSTLLWSAEYSPGDFKKWRGDRDAEFTRTPSERAADKWWQRSRDDGLSRNLLLRIHGKSFLITLELAEEWGIAHLMPDWPAPPAEEKLTIRTEAAIRRVVEALLREGVVIEPNVLDQAPGATVELVREVASKLGITTFANASMYSMQGPDPESLDTPNQRK